MSSNALLTDQSDVDPDEPFAVVLWLEDDGTCDPTSFLDRVQAAVRHAEQFRGLRCLVRQGQPD